MKVGSCDVVVVQVLIRRSCVNSGIVLRYESMSYTMAVQHAALVLSLCSKAKQAVRRLLDPPDVCIVANVLLLYDLMCWVVQNEVESMRLHTRDYEMIVAQLGFYTMIVIQETSASAAKKAAEAARAAAEAEGAA